MNRRELMLVLGGVMTAAGAARAQQKAMPVIGILGVASPTDGGINGVLAAFRQGLGETGFVEGQNVAIEYRWAHNNQDRLPALAAELVALRVDVIVNEGGTPSALSAKNATSIIPIVFHSGDAIADGIVANLARPGGNLTGVSLFGPERVAKGFQLLSELVPGTKIMALLAIPNATIPDVTLQEIQEAARAKGVQLQVMNAATDTEIDAAYATLGNLRGAAVVMANGTFADKLVALAARHAVPAAYNQRRFAAAGGLLSVGPSIPAAYVIKGNYAGKILKGAKPGDLPVQQPTAFELIVNLKTAKALGLTVPQTLLARADEVIE